jgi:hypothetical protein
VTALGVLVGLVAEAWAVALCLSFVRRLHRLHIRVDAARAGLDAALARRAEAASRAGVGLPATAQAPPRRHPRRDARAATTTPVLWPEPPAAHLSAHPSADPEAAANTLSRELARLERAALACDVRADLEDAERLLVLARLVHNDAVRDTLGLRSRRLVRWLRLAGTAPMPAYFEIAEPSRALTYDRVSHSPE